VVTRKSESSCCLWGFQLTSWTGYPYKGPCVLQRLYSTFARGVPGLGLLCLRLMAAIAAFHYAGTGLASGSTLFRMLIECLAGLLICAGLWTPIAGTVLAIVALWSAFLGTGDPWPQGLLSSVGAALAMLGPGAWSVDARLFGRKRLIRER